MSAQNNFTDQFGKEITAKLEEKMKEHLEKEYEALKVKLIKDLDDQRDQIIAGLSLSFMRMVHMHQSGSQIVLTLRQEETK